MSIMIKNKILKTKTKSHWDRLPSTVVDLIFSYDSTYHEYMTNQVLQAHDNSNFRSIIKPSKESLFYQSIIKLRYSPQWNEILYILHQRTAHKAEVLFPQPYEIHTRVNYTMKLRQYTMQTRQQVIQPKPRPFLRKWIFEYDHKIHWYVIIESDITLQMFLKKFLSKNHMEFLAFSEIILFDNICSNYRYLVSAKRGDQYRRNPDWIKHHEFQSVVMTGFDIVMDNIILEMDVVNIFTLNGKIYVNIRFDDNQPEDYQRNKEVYHLFIYYLNKGN